MPQGPIATVVGKSPSGAFVPLNCDAEGNLITTKGGTKSVLNVSAAQVVKATPGRLARVTIVAPGTTSGAFVFNDCATTGAAAAANEIANLPFGNLTAGQVIDLDWPCAVGIVLSAVPGAGSPIINIAYD